MADETPLAFPKAQAFTATIIYCPVCTTNDEVDDIHSDVWCCNNCETDYTFLQVPLDDEKFEVPFTGAIIFCPSCCTSLDADNWGLNQKLCPDCSTEFGVVLDPGKVAEYSRYG